MRPTAAISAKRWFLLMLTGAGIIFLALLPVPFFAPPHYRKLQFVIVVLGSVLTLASDLRLQYAIRRNQCDDDELKTFRLNTKSVLWNGVHYSIAIIAVVFLGIASMSDAKRSLFRIGYAALMLSSTMTLIRTAAATTPKVQPPPAAHPTLLAPGHQEQP
jgi:hypothetical protein